MDIVSVKGLLYEALQDLTDEDLEKFKFLLRGIRRSDLVMKLTQVNSKNEVKTTVCHMQVKNTATNGGVVFNPNISECRFQTLNINVTSQVPACGHMTDQWSLQRFAPPPERPLSVFPSQVCRLLNLQHGQVDADDLHLLSLMEQWRTLEPRQKSVLMLKFQQMIHEARFDSDAS